MRILRIGFRRFKLAFGAATKVADIRLKLYALTYIIILTYRPIITISSAEKSFLYTTSADSERSLAPTTASILGL